VYEYLSSFRKYDWLWKDDKEHTYKQFMFTSPTISNFEAELKKFMAIEDEIEQIPQYHCIGALMLNTANLKLQLRNECRHWKVLYSSKVHQLAKEKVTRT
jgi:dynein heavy chain, axonemal